MCGIIGYFGPHRHEEASIKSALEASIHRGPDKQDYRKFDKGFLGHLRLSIIDLSEMGDQPMESKDGKLWIVFNGEIYNYQSLRIQLEKTYLFKSSSDTEVLLHGYAEWGLDGLVERIEGMFAFVIYDVDNNKIVGARDHLGKKPFFYFSDDENGFGFSSTLDSLRIISNKTFSVNDTAVQEYLIKSFISQPQTIYNEVTALMPGCCFEMDLDSYEIVTRKFWNPDFESNETRSESEWLQLSKEHIFKAVEKRLVADVPIASFLSGGIDSSLIVAIAVKEFGYDLGTYTVRFPVEEYNEADVASKISSHIGTSHTEFDFQLNLTDEIEDIISYFGQPFGDHSAIPTYFIAKKASENVKVVLTGDGGDEGFAGYSMSLAIKMAEKSKSIFGIGPLNSAMRSIPQLRYNKYLSWLLEINSGKNGHYVFDPHGKKGFRRQLASMPYGSLNVDKYEQETWAEIQSDWVRKGQVVDLKHLLVNDFLVKTDVMTMASGLESRSPLLDKNLMEFAFRIPSDMKLKNNKNKYLLRTLLKDYLPEEISNLPKRGFSIPMDAWIKTNKVWVREHLENAREFLEKYVEGSIIQRMLDEHGEKRNHGRQLWLLLILAFWYKKYIS